MSCESAARVRQWQSAGGLQGCSARRARTAHRGSPSLRAAGWLRRIELTGIARRRTVERPIAAGPSVHRAANRTKRSSVGCSGRGEMRGRGSHDFACVVQAGIEGAGARRRPRVDRLQPERGGLADGRAPLTSGRRWHPDARPWCRRRSAVGSSLERPRSLARESPDSEREGPGRPDAGGGPGTSVAWTSPPGGCGNARVPAGGMWCAGPGIFNRPASATDVGATVTAGHLSRPIRADSRPVTGGRCIGGSRMASMVWVGRAPWVVRVVGASSGPVLAVSPAIT